MTDVHTGGCPCRASRFRFNGAPKLAIRCSCRDCHHVSGGGHLPQMAIARAALTRTGPIKCHQDSAASGSTLGFHLCADCGSPLLKTTSKAPDPLFIYPGALVDPSLLEPGQDVLDASRHPWDR